MSLKQAIPCPNYSAAYAGKYKWVGDIFGNNNYQNAGDLYTAIQFGMSGIEFVKTMGRSATGYTQAAVFPANASSATEGQAPTPANFTLHWYSANGTEVANNSNISAEYTRIEIYGV